MTYDSGRILMSVVRANQEMILAGILSDIAYVLIRFAGNEDPILAKHVLVRGEFPFFAEQSFDDVHHERHPPGGCFDEAKFQARKLLGNFVGNEVTKRE
jgi:hypothetical protein